jgi:hypothetical protein
VAVIEAEPLFVAIKEGTLPVPDAANPIAGFELVQLKLNPAGVPEGVYNGTVVPSLIVIFVLASIVGRAFTVIVNDASGNAHCPASVVNIYVPEF